MATPLTYMQRQGAAHKALAEGITAKQTTVLSEAATANTEARDRSFVVGGRASGRALRAKQIALKENTQILKDALMVKILRESMPFNLEHISDEQMSESIKDVEKRYSKFLNERVLVQPEGLPNGFDVNSPNSLNMVIGAVNGQTPFNIARAAIIAPANICTNKKLDVTVSMCYNAVDTAFVRGQSTDTPEQSVVDPDGQWKEYIGKIIHAVGTGIGREVRNRLGKSLQEEAERSMITEEDRLFGLSEGKAEMERQKIRKEKRSQFHLMEEVYKCIRTLDETKGATEEDYLNEAAFHVGVIHAYSLLEAVNMSMEDIAMELRNLRK